MQYHKFKAGEQAGTYIVNGPVTEDDILKMAKQLARKRLAKGSSIDQPQKVFEFFQTQLMDREYEVFGVLFLDNRHRVIVFEELFRGTIDGASVFPREVVKQALAVNAAAVILVHNHPTGDPLPSDADRKITGRIKDVLGLVDIRTLDHVVVGVDGWVSFAEQGLI